MGRLYDNLGGMGDGGGSAAPADNAEGLGFVLREAAHPLVENGGDFAAGVAVLFKVFVGERFKGADGGDVLNKVAQLAVADSDALDALLGCKKRLDDGNGMAHERGNERAGQRSERFAVDADAHLFIKADQAVNIHPVHDASVQRNALGIGDVVGNSAALVAGETAGQSDFGKKSGIGGSVANLDRDFDGFSHSSAAGNAVVDGGEAVEHRHVLLGRLADAVFSFFIAVQAGVAVDGGGKKIRFAFVLKVLHELDVILNQRNAGSRLNEGAVFLLCFQKLCGKALFNGDGLLVFHGFVKGNILAGSPLSEYNFALPFKGVAGELAVFDL